MRFVFCVLLMGVITGCSSSDDGPVSVDKALMTPSDLALVRVGETAVRLTWTDNNQYESGFQIERRINQGVFSPKMFTSEDVVSFVDSTDLNVDSTYYYRVAARQISVLSGYTNVDSITFSLPYP